MRKISGNDSNFEKDVLFSFPGRENDLFSYSVTALMPRFSKISGQMRTDCSVLNSGEYSMPAMPYFAPAVL